MKVELNEAEVKVALREYVQKNIKQVENPWGSMSVKVNGKRLEKMELNYPVIDQK
jgi:hypothetical protein